MDTAEQLQRESSTNLGNDRQDHVADEDLADSRLGGGLVHGFRLSDNRSLFQSWLDRPVVSGLSLVHMRSALAGLTAARCLKMTLIRAVASECPSAES